MYVHYYYCYYIHEYRCFIFIILTIVFSFLRSGGTGHLTALSCRDSHTRLTSYKIWRTRWLVCVMIYVIRCLRQGLTLLITSYLLTVLSWVCKNMLVGLVFLIYWKRSVLPKNYIIPRAEVFRRCKIIHRFSLNKHQQLLLSEGHSVLLRGGKSVE